MRKGKNRALSASHLSEPRISTDCLSLGHRYFIEVILLKKTCASLALVSLEISIRSCASGPPIPYCTNGEHELRIYENEPAGT